MDTLCPVCGYVWEIPFRDFDTCPCCGTEYGYHDFSKTQEGRASRHRRLRRQWLEREAPWFSPVKQPPDGWNPYEQVLRLQMQGQPARAVEVDNPSTNTGQHTTDNELATQATHA